MVIDDESSLCSSSTWIYVWRWWYEPANSDQRAVHELVAGKRKLRGVTEWAHSSVPGWGVGHIAHRSTSIRLFQRHPSSTFTALSCMLVPFLDQVTRSGRSKNEFLHITQEQRFKERRIYTEEVTPWKSLIASVHIAEPKSCIRRRRCVCC